MSDAHDPRQQDLVFQYSHAPGASQETFQDQIRGWFKSAPWFAVSAVVHALLILLLFNIPWSTKTEKKTKSINASMLEDTEEVIPPPPPPPIEEPEEVEVVEDPVITEEETDEVLEEVDTNENPFDSNSINDVIGLGGGAGGGFGGKYRGRGGKKGGKAAQKAVDWGLDWLYRHQFEDGHWGAETFQELCDPDICSGTGHATVDIGVTGLALLAFLGANHTPASRTKYSTTVKKGLRWLRDQQGIEIDGLFGRRVGTHYMYCHGLATLAMCEGFGLSNQPIFRRPAQQAMDFISRARNPYKVWRYDFPPTGREEDNDVSVTGWMVFALSSAKDFKLSIDKAALEASALYIDEMTDPTTGRTGYNERGGYSSREEGDDVRWPRENVECMTAVGMLCRMLLLEDKTVDPESIPELKLGAELLAAKPPKYEDGHVDYYYWYYGSYAMYQMSGRYWDNWSKAMERAILNQQVKDEELCAKGSWDPYVDPWGDVGGRVYSTALCVLCLEVYYRYDKILGSR